MKKILFILAVVTGLVGNTQTIEREVVASSGDFYSNNSAELSVTIGEPVTETAIGTTNQLTQGFHQTNVLITSITNYSSDLELQLFPNPSANYITIRMPKLIEELNYSILDLKGKIIVDGQLISKETRLNVKNYPVGVYFITITNKQQQLKSYKLVKQ